MRPRGYLRFAIAGVWLANGLFCKVLNLVPRHQAIVAEILGPGRATLITRTLGVLEILMCFWVLSRIKPRWCAAAQIVIVLAMNLTEFILAPQLLLFGRFNLLVAIMFVTVVSMEAGIARAPRTALRSRDSV